jgi:hypothetical protein
MKKCAAVVLIVVFALILPLSVSANDDLIPLPVVDRSELFDLIVYAMGLSANEYTGVSWNMKQVELFDAQEVYQLQSACADLINMAIRSLTSAIQSLVRKDSVVTVPPESTFGLTEFLPSLLYFFQGLVETPIFRQFGYGFIAVGAVALFKKMVMVWR